MQTKLVTLTELEGIIQCIQGSTWAAFEYVCNAPSLNKGRGAANRIKYWNPTTKTWGLTQISSGVVNLGSSWSNWVNNAHDRLGIPRREIKKNNKGVRRNNFFIDGKDGTLFLTGIGSTKTSQGKRKLIDDQGNEVDYNSLSKWHKNKSTSEPTPAFYRDFIFENIVSLKFGGVKYVVAEKRELLTEYVQNMPEETIAEIFERYMIPHLAKSLV